MLQKLPRVEELLERRAAPSRIRVRRTIRRRGQGRADSTRSSKTKSRANPSNPLEYGDIALKIAQRICLPQVSDADDGEDLPELPQHGAHSGLVGSDRCRESGKVHRLEDAEHHKARGIRSQSQLK